MKYVPGSGQPAEASGAREIPCRQTDTEGHQSANRCRQQPSEAYISPHCDAMVGAAYPRTALAFKAQIERLGNLETGNCCDSPDIPP